ncbi:MAG: NAD-dependent epimerase/dehydratase family protein [Clostridiaceae bacterium]|nr:NAD-dependent epimerase/dehydratase family protein [Clostridiaceae bacterium]
MVMNKRVLITGGAGFIGTEITKRLSGNNEILLYDSLSRNAIQFTDLHTKDNIILEKGDILDAAHLESVVKKFQPQIVLHLAAIAGISNVALKPVLTMQGNLLGVYNLLEALKDLDCVEHVVDFSTSEIFGSYAYKLDETSTSKIASVGDARWTYSTSKLAAEHLTYAYYTQYGIPSTTVRPFNIYGPGQVGEGAIHQFISRAIRNETMQIHGDGSQIRSWCYISDFVDCIMLILENSNSIGEAFNIGNPQGTVTISMLARLIKEISKSSSQIIFVPKNYVDVELRVPSIEKASKILNYKPSVDLQEGLEKTIEWYRKIEMR